MIELTRLNHHPIAINIGLIQWIEPSPDTTITLVTGEKLVVRERYEDVVRKVSRMHRATRLLPIRNSRISAVGPGFRTAGD